MSKAVEIMLGKIKEQGIEGGEIVLMKLFEGLEQSMPLISADAETSSVEKMLAGVLAPVISGLKPAVQKAVDFDKDGLVG